MGSILSSSASNDVLDNPYDYLTSQIVEPDFFNGYIDIRVCSIPVQYLFYIVQFSFNKPDDHIV